jgi:hypothetical protein
VLSAIKMSQFYSKTQATIHIHMEVPQGNYLCSYLKQAKMSLFSFYKIGEQEDGTGSA